MASETKVKSMGLLTVDQCAEYLQCSVTQVERFIHAGELRRVPLSMREVGKSQRGPKGWRVTPAALQDFIAGREDYEPKREDQRGSAAIPAQPKIQLPMATGTDGKSRLRTPKRK